jgi:hypothetical protein
MVILLMAEHPSEENCLLDIQCLLDKLNDGSIRRWDSAAVESKPGTFGEGDGVTASRPRRLNRINRAE